MKKNTSKILNTRSYFQDYTRISQLILRLWTLNWNKNVENTFLCREKILKLSVGYSILRVYLHIWESTTEGGTKIYVEYKYMYYRTLLFKLINGSSLSCTKCFTVLIVGISEEGGSWE